MLHVHRSHRLEALADALATVTRTPLRSALATEIVVVQSLGIRRWLSLALAERLGVTLNVRFPFPAAFAHEVFRAAFGESDDAAFGRELLPWRVLAAFPRLLREPGWEELRGYVEGERRELKEYQLAQRIAAIFDRYLAYRPEMLLEWQGSRRATDWQAQLWRELGKGRRDAHPPALLKKFVASVDDRRTNPGNGGAEPDAPDGHSPPLPSLPERVSVFGISSLPPLYLHLIDTVARVRDVHLFLLEPTDQYWGDLLSPREQDRRLRDRDTTPEDEHFDTGHPLLSSLGKVGREFTRLVQDLEPASTREYFDSPQDTSPSLLHRVQADIFALRDGTAAEREPVASDDRSIQVHCCHGPMREVEVLHDQLLDLFERSPDLTPRDILVAMPDVESYAPLIEAVFGSPEEARHAIPFTVADRTARAESSVADAFLRLLDLHGTRFTAPAVLALLDCPALRARFAIGERDLETIREWIVQTGIRWGIDEEHRASLGLPRWRENTWRAGLERLLLGYALPGDGRTLFEGVLPRREIEGTLAVTLGSFVEFTEALFAKVPALSAPRPLPQWADTCRDLLHTFFDDSDPFTDEVRRLREVCTSLTHLAAAAEFAEPLTFEVLRAHLDSALADTDSGLGFLVGAVTFCALKPMRAIPFKVICLLGMNDTAFPRRDPGLAFDRLASDPRRGDRSQRDDDRYLFLEAILSAREVLYLSYSGLSPRDNSAMPPSVVVSELLDYLTAAYQPAACHRPLAGETSVAETSHQPLAESPAAPASGRWPVTQHRLQAFSPAYFTRGSRLFSYSAENARTSESGAATRTQRTRFAATPLPEPGPEWRAVDVEQLANFFAHPAKFFARERLRLALPDDFAPLDETEPLELPGLTRYQLGEELTRIALDGAPTAAHLPVARASGVLPQGYAGDSDFGVLSRATAALAARIRMKVSGAPLAPAKVDATLGDWRLTGTLHGVYPTALLRHRAAKLKSKDLLRAWIAHLALQLSDAPCRETWLIASDGDHHFTPRDDAREILADLLALYAQGLRAPLPLFPETSREFALRTLAGKGKAGTDRVASARRLWEPQEFGGAKGESEDAWFRLCFPPDTDPLDARWQEIAQRVFRPILAGEKEAAP
jgi:exodeoxyribonuclease V gamma subunit